MTACRLHRTKTTQNQIFYTEIKYRKIKTGPFYILQISKDRLYNVRLTFYRQKKEHKKYGTQKYGNFTALFFIFCRSRVLIKTNKNSKRDHK
jgi:hypothetical protein